MKKKKIVYTDNKELGELEIIEDTLPSPQAFKKAQIVIQVNLPIEQKKLQALRRASKTKKASYEQLIRRAMDEYISLHIWFPVNSGVTGKEADGMRMC